MIGYRAREILRRFRERNSPLKPDPERRQKVEERLGEARTSLGDQWLLHPTHRVRRKT